MRNSESERLLTTQEAAQILRVHPKTVIRWARSGKLPSLQTPTGGYRFTESDLLDTLHTAHE